MREVPNTPSITGDVRKSKINSISVDLQNNIYFSGSLRLTMNWGNNVITTSRGNSDIILLKYDSKGNIISGKTAGGTGSDRCDDITLSSSGNIYLSGNFSSTALFDTISVTGSGNINSFLTKISSGNIAGNINLSVIPQGFYNYSSNKLNIKYTVKIYTRNSVSPYSISDSSVSVIDSSTFKGLFQFMNVVSGNYYIQLKHRNTLETWSSYPVNYISGEIINYNFTNSLSKAYGNNQIQISNVNNLYGIFSGDVNQDGIIDAADLSEVDNDIINSATGYLPADLNGDGFVEVSDLSMVENNSSAGIQIVKP
ncbi:MAG: dockerin type I repeat-containing protein [Ignavibacteria bacterium]|nr:dockerin type I repeat-containing protein [Ignavibacteria bacterium]